jgi:D-amino-acid oxidase
VETSFQGRMTRGSLDAIVVGCGVIGLSVAVSLQEAGLEVRTLTAAPPSETTSTVAAALWYPYKSYPEDRVLPWGKRTYDVFAELSHVTVSGVYLREGAELWREPVEDPWWMEAVPNVRRCGKKELPPGYEDGHVFAAPVIEMPVYMDYLLDRFAAAGGSVERRVVSSLEEVAEEGRVVVNCSGLGARKLVGDMSMMPIRGQIMRVRNPGLERFLLDEGNPEGVTYIVPRTEDCVLGGTAEEGEWDTKPDPEIAAGIMRRCVALESRLAEAAVVEHRVGLRPGRPEVRLERNTLSNGVPCIHNYGHGGSGVTLSWGCAEEVTELVRGELKV